jgi:LysM domain
MAKRSVSKKRRPRDWPLWVVVALLIAWGISQALRLQSRVHAALHATSAAGQYIQNIETDSTGTPILTQAVYLSAQQATTPAPPGQDNSDHPDVLEVIDPGIIAATENRIARARQQFATGDVLAARNTLNNALEQITKLDIPEADEIREELTQINQNNLLGTGLLPGDPMARLITVEPGDTIDYLANLYRITARELLWLNPQVDSDRIRAGTELKVFLGPFDARLILHDARLDIYAGNLYIRSYNIKFITPVLPAPGLYNVSHIRFWNRDASKDGSGGGEIILEPAGGDLGQEVTLIGPPQDSADVALNADDMSELIRLLSINFSRIELAP